MAFVATSTKSINVTFEDRDGNESIVSFFAPGAAVTADVETFATGTLITRLSALSNATIRRVTMTHTFENDAFAQPPEESDVERKGVWVWQANDRSTSKNEIPSLKNTLVIDGTDTINTVHADVVAFFNMMVDTGLWDVYGMGNYRGVKLIGTKSAPKKIHRASSKG